MKKYYTGRGIRWMIADETGTSVYCRECGNIANGVLQIEKFGSTFNMPYCKSHIEKIITLDNPDDVSFVLPDIIVIKNPNFVLMNKANRDMDNFLKYLRNAVNDARNAFSDFSKAAKLLHIKK